MVTPQSLDYIKKQLSLGVSNEIIKSELQSHNWPLEDIQSAFLQIDNNLNIREKIGTSYSNEKN